MGSEVDRRVSQIAKIEEILTEAHRLRYSDYDRVIELAQEAESRARAIDYTDAVIRSLNHLAWSYNRLEQYTDATRCAKQAFALAQDVHDEIQQAYALSNLFVEYYFLNQFHEAMELNRQVYKIAQRHNHADLLWRALNDSAIIGQLNGDYDRAEEELLRCLVVTEALPEAEPHGYALINLSALYGRQGFYDRSNEIARKVLLLEGVSGYNVLVAYDHLVVNHLEVGDLEGALAIGLQGLELARQTGLQQVIMLRELAAVRLKRGELDQALHALQEAHALVEAQQNNLDMLGILDLMAEVYAELGDFQQAYTCQKKHQDLLETTMSEANRKQLQVVRALFEIDEAEQRARRLAQELNDQKRLEAERLERQRLEVALEKERELGDVKYAILNRLNHEFRTPLSVLGTSVEILTRYDRQLTDEQRRTHKTSVMLQVRQLERLLDDTLNALRAVTLQTKGEQPTQLRALWQAAMGQLANAAGRVSVDCPTPDASLQIDRAMVQTVLTHLLSNALKFSQEAVLLRMRLIDSELLMDVVDRGIGIPTDQLEAVFDPLVRGTNLDETPGVGLGLTVVRNYLNLYDGTITIQSEIGAGTTVSVRIPLNTPEKT